MNLTRRIRFLLALLFLLGAGIAADHLGMFAGIDNYLYDFSFRLRGQRTVSERIVIAAIDEKTLAAYGKWPIPRSVYASLLDATWAAQVVGFDVVMSEPAEDDGLLAVAVKKHGRVVVPVYLDRTLSVVAPALPFSSSAIGHVHVEQGVDTVTRELFHALSAGSIRIPSLSSAMYDIVHGAVLPNAEQYAAVKTGSRVFQQDLRKINYYGPAGTFTQCSVADILAGKWPPQFFENRIVLVGLTAPGIIDEISTPFSQYRNRMTGVEMHANALNNLIDGSAIIDVPDWQRILAVFLAALLLWLILPRVSERNAVLVWILSLLGITAAFFLLFATADHWLNPSLFYASMTVTFLISYLERLDSTAMRLDAEHTAISALLGGVELTHTAQNTVSGLPSFLSEEGINRKIDRLLSAQQQYSTKLEKAVRERTEQLEDALATISSMSDEMVLRLAWAVESKDKDTGEHTFRLGLYARVIAEKLGLPAEFIESIVFASALHDVGKIGIPDDILLKTGPLNAEEMEVIKTHCLIGQRILGNSSFPKIRMCASIALNHHERWDGTGYPNGLQGEAIPLEARIISICDCYDSLRSRRPYKEEYDQETAFRIITEGNSRTKPDHFDPRVLQAFIETAPALDTIFSKHRD